MGTRTFRFETVPFKALLCINKSRCVLSRLKKQLGDTLPLIFCTVVRIIRAGFLTIAPSEEMRSQWLKSALALFLTLVFNIWSCCAANPNFEVAIAASEQREQQWIQAFRDAITLARVVSATFEPCEEVRKCHEMLFKATRALT